MDDQEPASARDFDNALIGSAFDLAAREGWSSVSVAAAARSGGLPLDRARARFPTRTSILMKFGSHADELALSDVPDSGSNRERIFDVVMRRFDALQEHREGVLALLRALPFDPGTALLLGAATRGSMGWMLEAAGISSNGLRGRILSQGLVAVWLYTLRAWTTDDSPDLSGTMAALDRALSRAEQFAGVLDNSSSADSGPKPFPESIPGDTVASAAEIPGDALLLGASGAQGIPDATPGFSQEP